jgi:hypothetical protein
MGYIIAMDKLEERIHPIYGRGSHSMLIAGAAELKCRTLSAGSLMLREESALTGTEWSGHTNSEFRLRPDCMNRSSC